MEITGVTTGTEGVFSTSVATAQLQPSPSTNAYMTIFSGVTGTEVVDQSLNPMLQVEDDETKSLSRVLSVTRAATGGVVGAVLKNTAGTGWARLQLDANGATGFAQLEVASTGNCTLNAPSQEIWLQNRVSGQAPLIVETTGVVTTSYGQNDLSDARIKQNVRDADLEELQAIFDGVAPKRYDRVDADLKDRLGFIAQDFEGTGVTGTTRREQEQLLTLDYGKLTAEWRRWKTKARRLSLGPRDQSRVDDRGDLPAQVGRNAAQLTLGVAVLHDFSLAPDGAPLSDLGLAALLPGLLAAVAAKPADGPFRHPVQVAPDPGELAVRIAVSAVADVSPRQRRHEGAQLEQAGGWILQGPEARLQLLDYLQSSQHQPVAFFQTPGPPGQHPAVLGAHRAGPDHVEIARRELGQRLPAADVGADRWTGLGVHVKRDDFPPQLLEGSAHRPSPRKQLQKAWRHGLQQGLLFP